MVIKHGKNYEAAETILTKIEDDFITWDLEIMWCLVVLKRYHGNRKVTAAKLGISYRTLTNHISALRTHGFIVPESDHKFHAKRRKNPKDGLEKIYHRDGPNR